MSEEKKRTVNDIQQEYHNTCTRAGHVQYQLFCLNKDLELINAKLRDLNIEAATSQKEEAEKPKAEESKE